MATQAKTTTEKTFSTADLQERTIYRRGVEAAIWGMPIVAIDAFLRSCRSSE